MIVRQVFAHARADTGRARVAVGGCSFGGYHAMNVALRHPDQVYTFESHQRSHGISYQTARTDLLKLLGFGLLVQTHSGKQLQYHPASNLAQKLGLSLPRRLGTSGARP